MSARGECAGRGGDACKWDGRVGKSVDAEEYGGRERESRSGRRDTSETMNYHSSVHANRVLHDPSLDIAVDQAAVELML